MLMSFRSSILLPLFKKGDPTLPSNYRGLSLFNCICKIFTSPIINRLTFWVDHNNILNEFQADFRNNYLTVDNIFNLTNIIEINNSYGKKNLCFFCRLLLRFWHHITKLSFVWTFSLRSFLKNYTNFTTTLL